MAVVRLIRITFAWAALGVLVGLVAAVAVSQLGDYRTLNMLTGSMSPAIKPGDVVIDDVVAPRELRAGDVVTFPDSRRRGRLVTHRVRSVAVANERAYVVTQGDANNASERWSAPADGELGRVAYTIPKVAYLRQWLGARAARVGAVLLLLLAGAAVLIEVWRKPGPSTEPATGEA